MPRSVLVYLADITGACEAIARFLADVDYAATVKPSSHARPSSASSS
jgi:uncharacterized protein with HEPN domain